MKSVLALLFLVAVPASAQANPLGKVIELLDSLAAKITKEGEAEAQAFKEFTEWCDNAARNSGFEIKTATSAKDKFSAAISKQTGDAQSSASKIDELAGSIAADDADLKSATTIRTAESKEFLTNEAELMDVVDTLGRATTIIQREMSKKGAAFAQLKDASNWAGVLKSLSAIVEAASFSTADKKKLLGLVQSQQGSSSDDSSALDGDELGAPAATVYNSHSGNIVDVLEDLKEKAEEQLSDLRKADTNARHNYEMLKQSLSDQIAADSKQMADQKQAKAAAEEAKATAQSDLAAASKDLADAEAALKLANSNCMQTAADHEATVAARTEELKAISDARELLTSSTSGAEKQTYSLLQIAGASAEGSSLRTRADLANAEIVMIVKRLAQEHHSAALSQLASRISAVLRYGTSTSEDPFVKVRGMISEMISKLEAEAGSEATEKSYCDEQIAKTEEKKGELEHDLAKLTAKIDQQTAKSAGLKTDVQELQAELATLSKQQAEMDAIRQESSKAFVQAKAELEAGLQGVRKALTVLREYYGAAAASAAAMVQQPDMPELHSKASGAGTSIIGLLEVVEADFAKNLAKEETQEDDAASEYQRTTQSNKVTRTLKEQDVKYKTQQFKGLDQSVAEYSADRETSDTELSAVMEYYSKIKERCIAKPETYEERKRRRTAEIEGLKQALNILEDETAFMQRKKRGLRSQALSMPAI